MANPICHGELMVRDPKKTRAFYDKVFAWTFVDQPGGEYTLIQTGSEPGGGVMASPPSAPGPALNVYFQVDEVDATLRQAVEAGATVVVPKSQVPGVGHFAIFLDPDQIPIGIFDSKP